MAVFSVNQVRQFFVADASTKCVLGADGSFYFQVIDANGKTRSTQSINPEDVDWIHLTGADAMKTQLKAVTVTLDATAFPSDKTIGGQDYILRINFRQAFGMSDEDIYQKYGAVHGTSTMTKAQFIAEMIYSLKKNLSREQGDVLDFVVNTSDVVASVKRVGGVATLYDANGDAITVSTATGFKIVEKSQESEWALGTKKLERVYFDVVPTTVTEPDTYDEIIWATTSDSTTAGYSNIYQIADMEYFYHGYRGDQYRGIKWPDVIESKYMVDVANNKTYGYDVLDIQWHYAGDNEDSLKSAKTLTLVAPNNGSINANLELLTKNAVYCA